MFGFTNQEFDTLTRLGSFVYFVSNGGWECATNIRATLDKTKCEFDIGLDECYLWGLCADLESKGYWKVRSDGRAFIITTVAEAVNDGLCVFLEMASSFEFIGAARGTVLTGKELGWSASIGRDEANPWQEPLSQFLHEDGRVMLESLPTREWSIRTFLGDHMSEDHIPLLNLSDFICNKLDLETMHP